MAYAQNISKHNTYRLESGSLFRKIDSSENDLVSRLLLLYLMCSEGVAVHIQRGLGLPSQASLIDHHGNMLPGVQLKQSITVEHSLLHLWRGGRMRCKRWRGRGVEGWRGGGVEEWRGGGVEEWRDGGMRCKK